MAGLIWTIVLLLAALWFLGYSIDIGWWIHVLLAVAIVGLVYNLLIAPLIAAASGPPREHPRDHEL